MYTRIFWNCCIFFQKTSNRQNKRWTERDYPWSILWKRVYLSHLTMELLTVELVSNASAHLFPDNTVSSLKNFLPEQLNLEGRWEVAFSELSFPSMYHNVAEGKFSFSIKNLQSRLNVTVWNPVSNLPSRIFWCNDQSHSRKKQSEWNLYHK